MTLIMGKRCSAWLLVFRSLTFCHSGRQLMTPRKIRWHFSILPVLKISSLYPEPRCGLMQEVGRIHQMDLCAQVDGRFLSSIVKVCRLKRHHNSQCYLLRHIRTKFCIS